jgi:hypothetical protein
VRKLTWRQCAFVPIFVVALLLCSPILAQTGSSGSGTPTWGSYSWQVTQVANETTTIVVDATFPGNPTNPGGAYVPTKLTSSGYTYSAITLPAGTQLVHEVHGNITLTVPQNATPAGKTPMNGSIVAMLKGNDNNVIASVKMQQFGPGIATVPISGKFYNALSVTNVYVALDVDEPGEQILYISLTMD